MNRTLKKALSVIAAVLIVFYAASFFFVGFDTRNILKNLDPVSLIDKIAEARKFSYVRTTIANEYVEEADAEKLLEYAYKGMVSSLGDIYSAYYTKEELDDYLLYREGAFGGIGVTVMKNYETLVIEVSAFSADSPAEKAGIKAGDNIISADGMTFDDRESLDAVIGAIPGDTGTDVVIGVYRPETGENLTFNITRGKIYFSNVSSRMIGDIGYIRLAGFTKNVSDDFAEALEKLVKEGMSALIIDIRGNGGGSLDEVIRISDLFLDGGMIVYIEDRYGNRKEHFSKADGYDIPLAVLIDSGSASASELLAGAVKSNLRGVLIGEKTFGKGIVQTDFYLSDGTAFKITTKKYYLPSGESIHGTGIIPDIAVEQTDGYANIDPESIPEGKDIVLKTALEYLSENK